MSDVYIEFPNLDKYDINRFIRISRRAIERLVNTKPSELEVRLPVKPDKVYRKHRIVFPVPAN